MKSHLVLPLLALATAVFAAPVPKEKVPTNPFVEWKYIELSHELTSPVLCGDKVVVGTGAGELMAFRAKDGEELWQYKHGKRIYHRPSTDGERVYFTSEDGAFAVSADKGEEAWRFAIQHGGGPTLADAKLGLVYAAGDDGNLYALDAKMGTEKWKADFLKDAPADRPGFAGKDARVGNKPARPDALVSDGKLLVLSVFDQSRVVAFDPKTGKRLWAFQADGWVSAAAAITDEGVFVGSYAKHVHRLDRETGKEKWKTEVAGRVSSAPLVSDATVYVATSGGGLRAVAVKDGKQVWAFDPDSRPDGTPTSIYSTPVLHRGALHFAAGEGQFYSVNTADGKMRWKLRPSEHSDMYSCPAFDGTRFFTTCRPRGPVAGQPPPAKPGEAALIAIGVK